MKKKSILLACLMAAAFTTSSKAAEAAIDFPVVQLDASVIEMASEASTEELCGLVAVAMATCNANLYNQVNVIIAIRDVGMSRSCERGFDQGYKDGLELVRSLSKETQEKISTCKMRDIPNWFDNK